MRVVLAISPILNVGSAAVTVGLLYVMPKGSVQRRLACHLARKRMCRLAYVSCRIMCRVLGPGERSLWGSGDLYIFRWSAKHASNKNDNLCPAEVVNSRDHGHQGANDRRRAGQNPILCTKCA